MSYIDHATDSLSQLTCEAVLLNILFAETLVSLWKDNGYTLLEAIFNETSSEVEPFYNKVLDGITALQGISIMSGLLF